MKSNYCSLGFFKQLFIVALFLCSFSAVAQKVKPDDVPQAVKTTFSQEFPNAKVKEWQIKDSQYWVIYKDDGAQQTSVFTTTGTLVETRTSIDKQELPDFVMQYVATEYPGYEVNSCFLIQKPKTKDSYYIEVKKAGMGTGPNSEITFTSDGKLLSRKDPEGFAVVKKEEPRKKEEPKKDGVKNERTSKKDVADNAEDNKSANKSNNKVREKAAKNPNEDNKERKSKNKKDQYPENIISENNVPAIVKKNFTKKFPKADEVKWFNKQGDTIYTIKCLYKEQDNEIKYTASGKWILQKIELDEKTIFPAVQKYLDKTYRKYKLSSCFKTVTFDKNGGGFEVKIIELKNKKNKLETTILFDKMGKLIKTIDPDVPYDEENDRETSIDRRFNEETSNIDANETQSGTKVTLKELPTDITSYVSANYPGMVIKSAYLREIDDLGMCYELSVSREGINQETIELVFDKSGKFLKNMNASESSDETTKGAGNKNVPTAFTPAEPVVNGFKTKHPKATKVTWEEGTENDFVASFSDGTGAHKSYFSADGNWIKISTVMSPESVSPNIKSYVEKNHKGYKIIAARNVKKADKKTYYEVDIQHKKTSDTQTLEFNQAGKPTTDAGGKE
jgi:hypothetical protein